MFATQVHSQNPEDPLAGLVVTQDAPERAEHIPEHWVRVAVQAASLNHHDLWSLRGVGLPAERLPMTLGTDAAGLTDAGEHVIVHGVINDPNWVGDQTHDPQRRSEEHTSELQSRGHLVCRLLLEKKKRKDRYCR